jgi:hypothetical protein
MGGLTDARGCLTDAGLSAFEKAPIGGAPGALTGHLAACARCQDRLLLRGVGASSPRRPRTRPPTWRMALVVAMALLLALAALIAARSFGG